jgi:formate hydrogenlyase subunit 4
VFQFFITSPSSLWFFIALPFFLYFFTFVLFFFSSPVGFISSLPQLKGLVVVVIVLLYNATYHAGIEV